MYYLLYYDIVDQTSISIVYNMSRRNTRRSLNRAYIYITAVVDIMLSLYYTEHYKLQYNRYGAIDVVFLYSL